MLTGLNARNVRSLPGVDKGHAGIAGALRYQARYAAAGGRRDLERI